MCLLGFIDMLHSVAHGLQFSILCIAVDLWARFVHEKNQKVLVPIVGCCHGSTLADASSLKAATEFDNCCVASFPGIVAIGQVTLGKNRRHGKITGQISSSRT